MKLIIEYDSYSERSDAIRAGAAFQTLGLLVELRERDFRPKPPANLIEMRPVKFEEPAKFEGSDAPFPNEGSG
jgi:hypothetical protein